MSSYCSFTATVKVKSIVIVGEPGTAPSHMRAFKNRLDVDFDNVEQLTPLQTWNLNVDASGELEYATKYLESFYLVLV